MKTFSFKKIVLGTIMTAMVFSATGLYVPHKAEASGWPVFDAANFSQNSILIANTTATAAATYASQFQNYFLNTLATALAKQLIRQITASVVNWINSGFEGSPSFITNPGGFFIDVADQVSGDFLAMHGGPLTDLCSPFSIDVRLALAFKYRPNVQKKYECTLGKIITNSKNAIAGANINGFTAGDFRQGGWPAFVSLTTEPQNNIYGAYLQADSELSIRVANAQIAKRDEISNGKGFLSWRDPKCSAEVKANNVAVQKTYESRIADYDTAINNYESGVSLNQPSLNAGTGDYDSIVKTIDAGGDASALTLKSKSDCPIKTPGSVIAESIGFSATGPLRELELVDSINEIVNALASQLITQILQKGLSTISGSGPSDSTSYINQVVNEANTNTEQVNYIKNELIANVTKYINDTLQYKTLKDQSLNAIIEAKNAYDAVKACYDTKTTGQVQAKKAEIDSIINTSVTPVATRLLESAKDADNRYKSLTDIRDQANSATTVNELKAPGTKFAQMIESQTLVTQRDTGAAQLELDETRVLVEPLKQDAQRKLQECSINR